MNQKYVLYLFSYLMEFKCNFHLMPVYTYKLMPF